MSWRPLLKAEQAALARERLNRLHATAPRWLQTTLGGGSLGAALALHLSNGPEAKLDVALAHAMSGVPANPGLMGGVAGHAFVLELLAHGQGQSEDPLVELDLPRLLQAGAQFDVVSGWVGVLVAALRRRGRPDFEALIDSCARGLVGCARRDGEGYCYGDLQDPLLGVAHGQAGAVWGLAALVKLGRVEAQPLFAGAVDWLLAARQGPDAKVLWGERRSKSRPRLAWCHGELGMAAALMPVALGLGHQGLEAACREACRRAGRVDGKEGRVVELSLCHGLAGVAHLFNRLGQLIEDQTLLERASKAYQALLEATAGPVEQWGFAEPDDPSVMFGSAGVMLVLDAAISNREPAWDEAFLCRFPF